MASKIILSPATLQYLLTGDLDDACKAIVTHTLGMPISGWLQKHHPANAESVRRCLLLIENCPEVGTISAMASVSPSWEAVVSGWVDLYSTLDHECPNWRRSLWANGCWQAQETQGILRGLLK
jgi:hypothetical protein